MENDEEEKNRRWKQCVSFLRNNPKLMLQMIPNDSDDDIDAAKPIGKPKPAARRKAGKPPAKAPKTISSRD